MFKGEKPYDAAAVQAALAADDAACADWAKWWGADTQKGETLETWAKPEIWTDAARLQGRGRGILREVSGRQGHNRRSQLQGRLPGIWQWLQRLP